MGSSFKKDSKLSVFNLTKINPMKLFSSVQDIEQDKNALFIANSSSLERLNLIFEALSEQGEGSLQGGQSLSVVLKATQGQQ